MARFYRLLSAGEMVRLLEGEVLVGNGTPKIRAAPRASPETFDDWASRPGAATPANPIPIRTLVAAQFGAALATAEYLQQST